MLLAVALLAAACGGSDDEPNTDTNSSSDVDADTDAVLRFGFANAADGLDPQLNSQDYGEGWFGQAYERLLDVSIDGELSPSLATEWEAEDDGASILLTLRDDVTFSDGAPFDAEAVKANIERGQTVEGSTVASELESVTGVEVVDEHQVRLSLAEPDATFLTRLAGRAGTMISPKAMEDGTDLSVEPVGTGAFVLEDYQPDVSASYTRRDDYWGEPAKVAGIEVTVFTDTTAGTNALVTDQIDMYEMLSTDQQGPVEAAGLPIVEIPSTRIEWIALNFGGKFEDIKVREALSHAIDREAFVGFAGRGEPDWQWVPSENALFDEDLDELHPYDPEKAKELLAEAGFEDGFDFTITFSARPYTQSAAEVIQEMIKPAGFNMSLEATDGATTVDKCYVQHQCDAVGGIHNTAVDFAVEAQDIVAPGARRNLGGEKTIPSIMDALDAALQPADDRHDTLAALQAEMTKQVPVIVIRTDPTFYGTSKRIASFELNPYDVPIWNTVTVAAEQ
jgi:peptide/nickel transport system substrate-binding protein